MYLLTILSRQDIGRISASVILGRNLFEFCDTSFVLHYSDKRDDRNVKRDDMNVKRDDMSVKRDDMNVIRDDMSVIRDEMNVKRFQIYLL